MPKISVKSARQLPDRPNLDNLEEIRHSGEVLE